MHQHEDDSDLESDGPPDLLLRTEERRYTIPSDRPAHEPPAVGLEELLLLQPDIRRARANGANVEEWELLTERELLVNYGQIVMEAAQNTQGVDTMSEAERKRFYEELAESLLIDSMEVNEELEGY